MVTTLATVAFLWFFLGIVTLEVGAWTIRRRRDPEFPGRMSSRGYPDTPLGVMVVVAGWPVFAVAISLLWAQQWRQR